VSQIVITWPNGSFNDSATLFVFWFEMSIPASFITSLARGLDALRSTPTLTTSNRSPVSFRRKPSAIRLRVAFPVERNRTFGLCLVISFHLFDPNWAETLGPTMSHPYAGMSHEGRQFHLTQSLEINLALRREVLSITAEPSRTRCPLSPGDNDHGIWCAGAVFQSFLPCSY
jgi:hypothetical protein